MINKHASAHWEGSLKEGKGYISTESGALDQADYSFKKRFEDSKGTNPEELIGAAHAGCFSMALSMILGEQGLTANTIDTKSTITLDKVDDSFAVTKAHLALTAKIPNASKEKFLECAKTAKDNCPISKLLNAEITMDATLIE